MSTVGKIGVLGVVLIAGIAIGGIGPRAFETEGDDSAPQPSRQASPDEPPAEFAYLDSARVLAYLGQIEGGLAETQERTLSVKTTGKASLTAKDIASVEASSEKLRGSSETVTFTEAARFYTLLRILREPQGTDAFRELQSVDARIVGEKALDKVLATLKVMEEGDFLRIYNAHLSVPTYAAILPRARFASYYLGGRLQVPQQDLYAPVSSDFRRLVRRYKPRSTERVSWFCPGRREE